MTEREERIPNYIDYPYDVFIKLRLEFLLICQDEIEAKVMRIIEKAIEDKRKNLYRIRVNKTPKGEEVQLPEQIWVAISHTFFLDRLYGTVQSENTLKAALKSLADKKLILRRAGGNRPYDAQEYTLNKKLILEKLAELPLLDELNVMAMMKQPRKPRKSRKTVETEGQTLRVSKFDTLDDESEGQTLTPQSINNCPPGVSNFDTNEGQTLTPLPRYTDSNLDNTQRENAHVSDDTHATPSSLSESNSPSSLQETEESTAPSEQSSKQESGVSHSQSIAPSSQQKAKQAPEQGKKTTAKPDKPVKPAKVELTTEFASDDERSMWDKLSAKERTFYARMNTQERAIYTGWCSLFKKSRHPLGEAVFDACRTLGTSDYSSETLDNIRKWCFATDKKTANYPTGYYRERGVKLWDIAEKAPDWELIQEMGPAQKPGLKDQRTRAGIKTGVEVGSSMPPQKPEPTQAELDEIERKMIEMGIKPATRKGA